MPSIACADCGASAPTLAYYQCKDCGRVHCVRCGSSPVKEGSGFWSSMFQIAAAGLTGDSRCVTCFNKETGEGGNSRLVYSPPSKS